MSKKARRRPSWKKKDESSFILHLLNQEDDSLFEIVRIPGLGYFGKMMIKKYGKERAESLIQQVLINYANGVLADTELP